MTRLFLNIFSTFAFDSRKQISQVYINNSTLTKT